MQDTRNFTKMFFYPPKPGTIFFKSIPLENYLVQWKWRGWRICIDQDGECFTRTKKRIDVKTNFPKQSYDYQLDGEIISKSQEIEYQVKNAIKTGDYEIKIFDIFIPSKPDLKLIERLEILKNDFGIEVKHEIVKTFEEVNSSLSNALSKGREGIVLKLKDSIWRSGTHISNIERDWIKVKTKI